MLTLKIWSVEFTVGECRVGCLTEENFAALTAGKSAGINPLVVEDRNFCERSLDYEWRFES